MDKRMELELARGDHTLTVRRFAVHEALSQLYEIDVFARSPEPDVDLASIVGKDAAFTVTRGAVMESGNERSWSGVCARMALIHAEEEQGTESLSTYHLRIVPHLWLLSRASGCRIFQRRTIPDVARWLLASAGVTAELRLTAVYKALDYVVQYDETDLDFFHRLLERAGIGYFFDHAGGRPGVLVLTDAPQAAATHVTLPYNDRPRATAGRPCVSAVRLTHRVAFGRTAMIDYDLRRGPRRPVLAQAGPAPEPEDRYEQFRYGPGAGLFVDPDAAGDTPVADDKAKARTVDAELEARTSRWLEAERCRKRTVGFATNTVDLWPGAVLEIEGHPRDELDERLLVTEVTLEGTHREEWQVEGEAAFATLPYRPVERTPRPFVAGVQTGVVVGPAGEEIHADELGRVRVQLHWDREGVRDDNASCWMRVSQSWAGAAYGAVVLPRIGQEVLVAFLDGDPDHPLVVGRVHNAVQQTPKEQELPRYLTRTSWMSDTSPHEGASFNVIRFEDKKDEEVVFFQAQRDMQKLVKHDETERTGQNRATLVGASRFAVVAEADTTLVGHKYSLQAMVKPTPAALKILQMDKPTVEPVPTKIELVHDKALLTTGEATIVLEDKDGIFESKELIGVKAGKRIVVKGSPNVHINPNGGAPGQAGCMQGGAASGSGFVTK
jgi:type VI secretion system secreted protein VgrG